MQMLSASTARGAPQADDIALVNLLTLRPPTLRQMAAPCRAKPVIDHHIKAVITTHIAASKAYPARGRGMDHRIPVGTQRNVDARRMPRPKVVRHRTNSRPHKCTLPADTHSHA